MLHSMESQAPGTAGPNRPESGEAPRRSCPTPLETIAGALVVATVALALAWAMRSGDRARGDAGGEVAYVETPAAAGPTVSLAIDFGNGVEHRYAGIAWKEGMTAADAMAAARGMSPPLAYATRGSGEMTLLTSLDGVTNGAGDGRYWFYEVNGRRGEVSFAVQPLAAGDRVLWTFKKPE